MFVCLSTLPHFNVSLVTRRTELLTGLMFPSLVLPLPPPSFIFFCLQYLVFDTQMMLGGNHKYSVSPEEYIFAALSLYVDIVNLFLMILQIVGYANKD